MGIYARCVLPRLIHVSMGEARVQPYWSRVIGGANPTINMVQFNIVQGQTYYVEASYGPPPSPSPYLNGNTTVNPPSDKERVPDARCRLVSHPFARICTRHTA